MDSGVHAAPVGRVIGTEAATPLEFWVGVAPGGYLQLDDVVVTERLLPGGGPVQISGMVTQVRARHEGARLDNDVFLVADASCLPRSARWRRSWPPGSSPRSTCRRCRGPRCAGRSMPSATSPPRNLFGRDGEPWGYERR